MRIPTWTQTWTQESTLNQSHLPTQIWSRKHQKLFHHLTSRKRKGRIIMPITLIIVPNRRVSTDKAMEDTTTGCRYQISNRHPTGRITIITITIGNKIRTINIRSGNTTINLITTIDHGLQGCPCQMKRRWIKPCSLTRPSTLTLLASYSPRTTPCRRASNPLRQQLPKAWRAWRRALFQS